MTPCCNGVAVDLDYLRLLDDRLMYSIEYKLIDQFPVDIEDKEGKLVQVTSPNQEHYKCLIPTITTYVSDFWHLEFEHFRKIKKT